MSVKPYFASSSKVWSSIEWVFGIEDCGYDGWEISADGNYRLDNPEAFSRIMEVLDSTTLEASVHAPFADLNLASLNYPIYRESIRQLCSCAEKAAEITDRMTIHPGYLSPAGKLLPDKVWSLHKEALAEIGTCADDAGIMVCLENMPEIPDFFCCMPDELFGMAGGIDGIGVTLDIGHANTVGEVDAFLARISEVSHLHIHDNNGRSDEHLAVGDGTINWGKTGKVISGMYSGICVVEGRNLEEASRSLDVFRSWF